MEKDINYYASLFFVAPHDLDCMRKAGEAIYDYKDQVFEKLYAWMDKHPFFENYYNDDVRTAIRDNEAVFWDDLLSANFSEEYILRQQFFGEIFAGVGIPFEACLAIWKCFQEYITEIFAEQNLLTADLMRAFCRLTNVADSLIMDGYTMAMDKVLQEKNASMSEMSTPVAQLWDGILLLPIVGNVDSTRAQNIMITTLERIVHTQAKVFIFDIGGVTTVDSAVANHLIKISKAARLMGCLCILSGISPMVAQTMVELGVDLERMETVGSLKDAFKRALRVTASSDSQHIDASIYT